MMRSKITHADFIGAALKEDALERIKQNTSTFLQESSIEIRCIDNVNFYFIETKNKEFDYTLRLSFDVNEMYELCVKYHVHTYRKIHDGHVKIKFIFGQDGPYCNMNQDPILCGTENFSEVIKLLKHVLYE